MYNVIIIEDDPMVADINRKYLERNPAFVVKGIFKNGVAALEFLRDSEKIDLVLLDYYTPQMTGEQFLERIHITRQSPYVIMVTSANDTEIVARLFGKGVIDYLVKPFEYTRFQDALERFIACHSAFADKSQELRQEEIDNILTISRPTPQPAVVLAKGLNEATLKKVRGYLQENLGEMFTTEQISEEIGLSRITIRRYVAYMVENGELSSTIDYQTGGRPSVLYFYPK